MRKSLRARLQPTRVGSEASLVTSLQMGNSCIRNKWESKSTVQYLDLNTITIHFIQSKDLPLCPDSFYLTTIDWYKARGKQLSLPLNRRKALSFGLLWPHNHWSCAQCPCDTAEPMFTHIFSPHIRTKLKLPLAMFLGRSCPPDIIHMINAFRPYPLLWLFQPSFPGPHSAICLLQVIKH